MYNISNQTRDRFEQETCQSAYQFLDNLSLYERDMVLLLMNLEYERGRASGEEEGYRRGYDEGYGEGYDAGLEEQV